MPKQFLILSGYACTVQIWEPVKEILSADHALTLVDWPPDQTPGFHRIADFAGWLDRQYPLESYNLIIGHSLGGLVAAHGLAQKPAPGTRLVLVESFVRPPGPFFQNLLMPGADPALAQQVNEMLAQQRDHFSPALQQSLRGINLWADHALPGTPTFALYGDRGCGDPEQVVRELDWPAELRARVPITVIPNACHFPMLENPGEVARAIGEIASRLPPGV